MSDNGSNGPSGAIEVKSRLHEMETASTRLDMATERLERIGDRLREIEATELPMGDLGGLAQQLDVLAQDLELVGSRVAQWHRECRPSAAAVLEVGRGQQQPAQ